MVSPRSLYFLLSLIGIIAVPNLAQADLRIGVAAEPYPPFASKDASGNWVGWEIDFQKALCAELAETCEIVEVAWDGIIPALNAGKFDAIIASMAITDDRKKTITFSRQYYSAAIVMIGTKGIAPSVSAKALKDKIIATQAATTHAAYVQKHFGAATLKTYPTLDEATADLAAGRVDVVQGETGSLEAFLASDAGKTCCSMLGQVPDDPETLGEGVGVGLRKDDIDLLNRIDAAIAAMAKKSAFAAITKSYPELATKIVVPGAE